MAELETSEQAGTAFEIVLGSIVRRLPAGEAKNFISQLPSLLQQTLQELPAGPDRAMTERTIESELMDALGVDESHACRIMETIGAIVEQRVSPGQIDDLYRQLPKGLRSLFATY